jgi:hypothetical protein
MARATISYAFRSSKTVASWQYAAVGSPSSQRYKRVSKKDRTDLQYEDWGSATYFRVAES